MVVLTKSSTASTIFEVTDDYDFEAAAISFNNVDQVEVDKDFATRTLDGESINADQSIYPNKNYTMVMGDLA